MTQGHAAPPALTVWTVILRGKPWDVIGWRHDTGNLARRRHNITRDKHIALCGPSIPTRHASYHTRLRYLAPTDPLPARPSRNPLITRKGPAVPGFFVTRVRIGSARLRLNASAGPRRPPQRNQTGDQTYQAAPTGPAPTHIAAAQAQDRPRPATRDDPPCANRA